jgi:membrane dipeptidase
LWFADGVRCASLVHYGTGAYAVGTGSTGPLTRRGIELLAEFRRLGIILDVTHLCDESFDQALDAYDGPVLASHNNCRALVPGDRQFADAQIRRLIERGAVIGVALDAWMLFPGWKTGETPRAHVRLEAVVDHIDHICQLAGNCRHVGIGSDLDGGYGTEQMPTGLESIADLQKLDAMLAERGYADGDIDQVFYGNWHRFFREHLPR